MRGCSRASRRGVVGALFICLLSYPSVCHGSGARGSLVTYLTEGGTLMFHEAMPLDGTDIAWVDGSVADIMPLNGGYLAVASGSAASVLKSGEEPVGITLPPRHAVRTAVASSDKDAVAIITTDLLGTSGGTFTLYDVADPKNVEQRGTITQHVMPVSSNALWMGCDKEEQILVLGISGVGLVDIFPTKPEELAPDKLQSVRGLGGVFAEAIVFPVDPNEKNNVAGDEVSWFVTVDAAGIIWFFTVGMEYRAQYNTDFSVEEPYTRRGLFIVSEGHFSAKPSYIFLAIPRGVAIYTMDGEGISYITSWEGWTEAMQVVGRDVSDHGVPTHIWSSGGRTLLCNPYFGVAELDTQDLGEIKLISWLSSGGCYGFGVGADRVHIGVVDGAMLEPLPGTESPPAPWVTSEPVAAAESAAPVIETPIPSQDSPKAPGAKTDIAIAIVIGVGLCALLVGLTGIGYFLRTTDRENDVETSRDYHESVLHELISSNQASRVTVSE